MLSKTKKIALLTTGLVGALVASSAVGVALSSCTTNNSSTEVEENTKYNTYINWSNPEALTNLVVDNSGLVYSDIYKTTIIAVTPSFTGTSVTIPASVTSITGYTEVLPSGKTIVRGAFQPSATYGSGTSAENGVTLNNVISTIKFAPNSKLKSIGAQAFNGCTLLQSIDLPTTVTMIGANAFNGCTLLESINLTNVEYVGQYAFANLATGLTTSKISVSLNKAVVVGNYAFQNANIVGVDFSANTALISMGNYAFDGCSSLAGTIDLSKATALTSTGTYTFQNCPSITAVNLPSSLRTIGDSAFKGCSSIANTIDLSGATKLSTIGTSAFQNCTKLTGLSYPVSAPINSFGSNAFSGCSALTQLGTVANTFTAPAALTTIASSAFSGTKIATVDISNMTVAVPFADSALAGMESLTEVKFNSAITTLSANLFNGDSSLKTITLPASITSVVKDSVTNITSASGYSAFYGSSLETVDMSAIAGYSTKENMGTIVPYYLFAGLTSLKNVVLKTGTTAIGNNSFQNTSSLVYVKESSQSTITSGYTTTETLTSIGDYAFQGTGLTSFTVSALSNSSEETKTTTTPAFSLGNYVFSDATNLKTVDLSEATNLTEIPTAAFSSATGLTTVTLPQPTNSKSLTIQSEAFSGVSSLTSIDFSKFNSLVIEVNNFTNANSLNTINLSNLTAIPEFISTANRAVFTGLPSSAVVQLSSAINTITNADVFTKTEGSQTSRVSLQYPNGLTLEDSQISSGKLTNTSLSTVTGDLNLSNNLALTTLGTNTLFGNTTLTSLTLPAKNITSNVNLYELASSVTANDPAAAESVSVKNTNQYLTANVPLGNNSALTSINFTNFNLLSNNVTGPGVLQQQTFHSIAKIMNSYAYYSGSDATNTDTASTNFKTWESTKSSWIEQDAALTYTANTGSSNNGGEVTYSNVTVKEIQNSTEVDPAGSKLVFTKGTSKKYSLTHNKIKWILTYDANTESLTIETDVSTPANIYRGYVSDNLTLQVYIKTVNNNNSEIDKTGVKVTMSSELISNTSTN